MNLETAAQLSAVDFEKVGGLVPVVVQHGITGEVLMLGYANREALERSLETRELWLYSRSRNELWHKGATSGYTHRVLSVALDCDQDAVLMRVDPRGPTCHTGTRSCFKDPPTLVALDEAITQRMTTLSEGSYTVRLLNDANLRLKKLGEEAVELAVACNEGNKTKAAEEAADLLYHIMVACRAAGATAEDVLGRLESRRK